jgi:hypothetical protein
MRQEIHLMQSGNRKTPGKVYHRKRKKKPQVPACCKWNNFCPVEWIFPEHSRKKIAGNG